MTRTISAITALRRGQKAARAGRLDAALAAFDAAGDASDPRLFVQHALVLARAGRTDAALDRADRAVALAPDDVVPAVFRAYLLLRHGKPGAARAEIDRAKTLSAAHPIVTMLEGVADVLAGDVARGCRKLLARPLADNLSMRSWILAVVERAVFDRVGADSGAVPPEPEKEDRRDRPPDKVPDLAAGACLRRGRRLLEDGRPHAARTYLERAVEKQPEDATARAMFGAALFECGAFDRAEAELARAPKTGPLAGVARFYQAANAYRLGRYEHALELLDALPQTGDAFYYREWCAYVRGMALVALGRTAEAAEDLAVFLDAEPDLLRRRLAKAIDLFSEGEQCFTSS